MVQATALQSGDEDLENLEVEGGEADPNADASSTVDAEDAHVGAQPQLPQVVVQQGLVVEKKSPSIMMVVSVYALRPVQVRHRRPLVPGATSEPAMIPAMCVP